MNTLDRPLFRQMGGPAQMMPQDAMVPDDAMMAVNEAEMAGAQVGQEYLEGTMQSLDQAETPKDVIDAIRGNQQPLETRYQELAGLVGEEDARQTPETVLALVQPTIMMTEQGAMDTGIAQLMQQMVGDVDMGGGSEMGQGVGSLMMAGASEAPVPQNFKQGGAVAYLALGSDSSGTVPASALSALQGGLGSLSPDQLQSVMGLMGDGLEYRQVSRLSEPVSPETVKGYYESLLPMYQQILGEDEESKRARQSGTFFDIAQAGLNLAAGVDPRTGKSTAGMPFGSQLAAAASQLPGQINARAAEQRKMDRGLRTAALTQALTQAGKGREFEQAYRLAEIKNRASLKPERKQFYDPTDPTAPMRVVNIKDATELDNATRDGFVEFSDLTASERAGRIFGVHADNYSSGALDANRKSLVSYINTSLASTYAPVEKEVMRFDPERGQDVAVTIRERPAIPDDVIRSQLLRSMNNLDTANILDATLSADTQNRIAQIQAQLDGSEAPAPAATAPAATAPAATAPAATAPVTTSIGSQVTSTTPQPTPIPDRTTPPSEQAEALTDVALSRDMQASFGSGAALQTLANNFFPFITLGEAGPAAPNLERVQAIYNQEAKDALAALFADRPTGDRVAEAERKELMETVPQTGRIFESAEKSLANHQSFVRKLRSKRTLIEMALAEPSTRGSGEALKKRQDQLAAVNKALSFWESATAMLQNSIEGTGSVDARLKTMGIEPTSVNRTQQMVQDVIGVQ